MPADGLCPLEDQTRGNGHAVSAPPHQAMSVFAMFSAWPHVAGGDVRATVAGRPVGAWDAWVGIWGTPTLGTPL